MTYKAFYSLFSNVVNVLEFAHYLFSTLKLSYGLKVKKKIYQLEIEIKTINYLI